MCDIEKNVNECCECGDNDCALYEFNAGSDSTEVGLYCGYCLDATKLYLELIEDGHSRYQAMILSGLRDPDY